MGNTNGRGQKARASPAIEPQLFVSLADNNTEFFGISDLNLTPIHVNPAGLRLVSDIGMPEEDGYTLIEKGRRVAAGKGGRIPAIAPTAYARAEERVRALNAGFQAHIPKPVEPVGLIAVTVSLARSLSRANFE